MLNSITYVPKLRQVGKSIEKYSNLKDARPFKVQRFKFVGSTD